MFQGFGHTAIWVKDMEKSLHFYLDILGCKKAFSMPLDGPGTGTEYLVASNGAFIELFYGGTPHETEKAPEGVHFTGFSHFCLVVDDMFGGSRKPGRRFPRKTKTRQRRQLAGLDDRSGRN